jgi:trans-2-enoyl-CoA reductase
MLHRSAQTARAVVYSSYGVPTETVKVYRHEIPDAKGNEVVIKLLAAPINPADINQVEGVYPSRPAMTKDLGTEEPSAVGGNEGVFEVVQVGSEVTKVAVGDWVHPRVGNFGTWRTYAKIVEDKINKIENNNGISRLQAATVSVNPATAHQMLKRFADLKPGDWFIQNGGNSGVGRAAIQLGRIWGLNSISVVRDRVDIDSLKSDLEGLGATHVLTEEQIADKSIKHVIADWTGEAPIRLAFNCVGGSSATNIARQLSHGGQLVTYGGMSKKPVTLPTSMFIFKDIVARGYWLSEWTKQDPDEKKRVVGELLDLYREKKLVDVPVTSHVWKETETDQELERTFKEALRQSSKGKQVIFLD